MQDMLSRFFEDKYEVYQANAAGQIADEKTLLSASVETTSNEFINVYEFIGDITAFYNFIFSLIGTTSELVIRILVNGIPQYTGAYNSNTGFKLAAGTHANQGDKVTIQIKSNYGSTVGLNQIYLCQILDGDITTWNNDYNATKTFYPGASGQMLLVVFPDGVNASLGTTSVNGESVSLTRNNYDHVYYTFIQVYKGKPVTISASSSVGGFICAYYSKTYKSVKNIKSIQRGFINSTGITSIKIGEINPNKTICMLDGASPGLINVNRLEENYLIINNRSDSAPVSYQLVEFW